MKIRMGFAGATQGYLQDRPDGSIAVTGTTPADSANLQAMVDAMYPPEHQSAAAAQQFLAALPQMFTGPAWAQDVALDGILGDIDRQ